MKIQRIAGRRRRWAITLQQSEGGRASRRRSSLRPIVEGLEPRRLLSTVMEYPLPAGGAPFNMVAGPDGNLWFVDAHNNSIDEFNPTTLATVQFPMAGLGNDMSGITVGPDGQIWFTDLSADEVGTIDLATGTVSEFPLPTPRASPGSIVTGPDGNLWFLELSGNGPDSAIGSINPITHAISQFDLPVLVVGPAEGGGMTVGPDGNLWMSSSDGNHIGMFNLITHAFNQYPVPTDLDETDGITAGPDGNVWYTNGVGTIGTVNAATGAVTEYPLPAATAPLRNTPVGITTASDGEIWFTNLGDDSVGMIDPMTHAVTEYTVPVSDPDELNYAGPFSIVQSADGNLWFTLPDQDEIGVLELSPPSGGTTGLGSSQTEPSESSFSTTPLAPAGPPAPGSLVAPPAVAAPIPNAPAVPGIRFSFTIALAMRPAPADGEVERTTTLILDTSRHRQTLSIGMKSGTVRFPGLMLERFDSGAGFRIVADRLDRATAADGSRFAVPHHLVATEKLLVLGNGKDRHVVGFRVVLARFLAPAFVRSMAHHPTGDSVARRWGPASLDASFETPDGAGRLTLAARAWIAPTGQVVILARMLDA